MKEIISFIISNELRRKIVVLRGDVPWSKFIARMIELMISDGKRMVVKSAAGKKSFETLSQQKKVSGSMV
ncbi:hypothetical protein BH18THE2_BH18THE2_25570 [soil metagenome]